MHKHDYLEITLITNGFYDYSYNDKHFFLGPGSIAICNRGDFHAENPSSNYGDFMNVTVTNIHLPELAPDCLLPDDVSHTFNATDSFFEICGLANSMYTLYRNPTLYAEDIINHTLCVFLLRLLEMTSAKQEPQKRRSSSSDWHISNMIKEYIDKYYFENLTLNRISEDLKLSPSLISHVFKKETGYSPMQYMTMLRIGEAQTLLTSTDYPMTEISGMLGYNTPQNFYIMFRKNIGISPSQYRKHYAAFQN